MMNLKFLKKSDLILVAALLVICAALLLPKYFGKADSALTAVVMKDGKVIETIDLSAVTETYEYDLECSPEAKLTVGPGFISYSYAECPDRLCVNTGRLTRAGDTAACLPSKTLVVIEGAKDKDAPDVITY